MSAFWTTAELHRRGRSDRDIRAAITARKVIAVRRGHFAEPGARVDVLRAVRVGGVATATTAARALGMWAPPDPVPGLVVVPGSPRLERLHVAVPRNGARLRDPDNSSRALKDHPGLVLHWTRADALVGSERTRIAAPLLLLEHAFAVLAPERALAILDSALHNRFVRVSELDGLAARLPSRLAPVVASADGRADSGIETIARFLLGGLGLRIEVLRRLDRVGEVDLLVEGRLIIELDGREFHDDEAFERDRRRDLHATVERYRTLRFTWSQVLFHWDDVEAAVLAALSATA